MVSPGWFERQLRSVHEEVERWPMWMKQAAGLTDMKKYTYSFSVWPSETWGFKRALFDLFRCLNCRVEMDFSERDFEMFRSLLNHDGFTLREVTRVPLSEPEAVS